MSGRRKHQFGKCLGQARARRVGIGASSGAVAQQTCAFIWHNTSCAGPGRAEDAKKCANSGIGASVACPDADEAVGRTIANGSRQDGHHADPAHPVPSCSRKVELKGMGQQKKAKDCPGNPVHASHVLSHAVCSFSFHFFLGACAMTRVRPQKPVAPAMDNPMHAIGIVHSHRPVRFQLATGAASALIQPPPSTRLSSAP